MSSQRVQNPRVYPDPRRVNEIRNTREANDIDNNAETTFVNFKISTLLFGLRTKRNVIPGRPQLNIMDKVIIKYSGYATRGVCTQGSVRTPYLKVYRDRLK